MENEVTFYLNGKLTTVRDPSPDLMLIDYLRGPGVSLSGPKKGCGQGGCGACTVILSEWNSEKEEAEHRAVNSCLRPVCALGGSVVTTVEGTGGVTRPAPKSPGVARTMGRMAIPFEDPHLPVLTEAAQADERISSGTRAADSVKSPCLKIQHGDGLEGSCGESQECAGMNPVAHRLAMNNGSQCGYCSVGFVMNMSEFLINHPNATKQEIEDAFDGNICRCTGYRAILTGMKTFASDWTEEDEANRMHCIADDGCSAQVPDDILIPFPSDAEHSRYGVTVTKGKAKWVTPGSIEEALEILEAHDSARLVHGNTSYGIYQNEYEETHLFVDIRLLKELSHHEIVDDTVIVGGGVSYSDLIKILEEAIELWGQSENTFVGATHFMARRTAGRIVRNAASIAGNSMLVLKHIQSGDPFPSDLFTVLEAIDARIEFVTTTGSERVILSVGELVERVKEDPTFADGIILLRYFIPRGPSDAIALAQKTALREVNSHSIVNTTTCMRVADDLTMSEVVLTFGGIAPYPWRARKTMEMLDGSRLSLALFAKAADVLRLEICEELKHWEDRMEGLVYEGFSDEYKTNLAVSFFFKALVNALNQKAPGQVPADVACSGEILWGHWGVSDGSQFYKNQAYKAPVSQPYIKLMAMFQTSGQVRYTHEYQTPPSTINAAFVQSRKALAKFHFRLPCGTPCSVAELKAYLSKEFSDFVNLITCDDVQLKDGRINYQGMGSDQPLFAVDQVSYVGQSIALVLAESETIAVNLAAYVSENCIGYSAVEWDPDWQEPVLNLLEAMEKGSVFPDSPRAAPFVSHIWRIVRPGSDLDWTKKDDTPWKRTITQSEGLVDGRKCHIIESSQQTGGQVHFYMETQSCVAEPAEAGRLIVHPSAQSPLEMHQTTAMALGTEYNQVEMKVRQVGGGYGGKTEQARFVTGPTAVAAHVMRKPVRLVMPRDEDTSMIGKRHAYYGRYQIAVDQGLENPDDKGIIRGMQIRMWGDGGAFYDCSFIVANCIQTRADNAYMVRNFETQIDVCRTNKAPSTAFRSFGDIQGKIMQENAIDDAAFSIGMRPEVLREKNLYQRGDVTPFGQALTFCYMSDVWEYLKKKCQYEDKLKEVDDFNRKNKWRKRGLGMAPVKYGSGYNLTLLEQATAVITIYSGDGTIMIHQGGVDMGQGLKTKVEQVASYILNVPMDMIQVEGPNTAITPNPTSTGGSTGTAYNGEAVKQACEQMRSRLLEFGYQMLKEKGNDWCAGQGIDFWNYGEEGWQKEIPDPNNPKQTKIVWQNLIQLAYSERVSLVASFNAKIPGGTLPLPNVEYKSRDKQPHIPGIDNDYGSYMKPHQEIGGEFDSFVGFTYSAACSVVEVDLLTGETKIISSDIVFDMGWSLNPAIDIGQIEGAFVQGVGYLLTEELVFEPEGPDKGRLNTVNTWRYKPPATTTIPLEMNVYLFPRDDSKVPENTNGLLSSKEVGEPPLVLSNTVFFAVKDAIRRSRVERGLDGIFQFDAPATVQEVRKACEITDQDLAQFESSSATPGS